MDKINEKTAKVRKNCSEYEFQSIHKLYERVLNPTETSNDIFKTIRTFIIHVYLNPGKALFETIVKLINKDKVEIKGEIARLNLYGNQSHCMNDKLLKNFCYCKDLLKVSIHNKTPKKL